MEVHVLYSNLIFEFQTSFAFLFRKEYQSKDDAIYHKDRTKSYEDYFHLRKRKNCKLVHIQSRLNLFTDFHNNDLKLLK